MAENKIPTVTAHAGCDGTAANTVESALKGLGLGADLVEVDVRADPDGALFLCHNESVPLLTGEVLPVSGLRVAELRALDREGRIRFDKPGGRITTFEELAAAVAPTGGGINLDLKDDRCVERIGPAVRAAGLEGRVVVTGCEADRVPAMRRASPGLPVYLNTDFGRTPPEALSRSRLEDECRMAADAGCPGLNIHYRFCTPLLVESARAHGLRVSVWTVGPEAGFRRFLELGVDNITTRHVAELLDFLGRRP